MTCVITVSRLYASIHIGAFLLEKAYILIAHISAYSIGYIVIRYNYGSVIRIDR